MLVRQILTRLDNLAVTIIGAAYGFCTFAFLWFSRIYFRQFAEAIFVNTAIRARAEVYGPAAYDDAVYRPGPRNALFSTLSQARVLEVFDYYFRRPAALK